MYNPYYLEEMLEYGISAVSSYSLINLVLLVFGVIVNYLIFEKAGERGWKSLIPFYSDYLEFKLYWHKGLYWLYLFMPLIAILLFVIGAAIYENFVVCGLMFMFGFILIIVCIVFDIKLKIKKAKCFGEPALFGLGLILFEAIFIAILAFDKKCQYIGNISEPKVEEYNQNTENVADQNSEETL